MKPTIIAEVDEGACMRVGVCEMGASRCQCDGLVLVEGG